MKSIAIGARPQEAWTALVAGGADDAFGWLAAKTVVTLRSGVLIPELGSKTVTAFVGE